ncbi:MAG: ATP-binding protein [Gemmatimonadales bacterium]|jgi:two-component system NtrC family sensor kinase
MADRPRFASLSSSLSFRLFLILLLTILGVFLTYSILTVRQERRMTEDLVKAEAYRASDFIRQSLRSCMMENDRSCVRRNISLLGNEPGVEAIRIYNKQGEITFSSLASEVNSRVDEQAEPCRVCHATREPLSRVPSGELADMSNDGRGHRLLRVLNPIPNTTDCSENCHAHTAEQSVLGVLDVQLSMAAVDGAITDASRRSTAVSAGLILLAVLLTAGIIYWAVHLPTRKLRMGTEALAAGDLEVKIDLDRSDELGQLASSFNLMAGNLRSAYEELKNWSKTLEERVSQKTAALEEANRQMIQMEKTASLGKMAATVAHELNNPLSGIVTYAKLVGRKVAGQLPEGPQKDKIIEQLDLIRAESMRCGDIVRDLLTYARGGTHELEEARLNELVERALTLTSHHLKLGHVSVERKLELADDRVVCDVDQIVQALLALLINAQEAMPEGGQLTVGTREVPEDPGLVELVVSDNGVGIPHHIQDRIFDPFFSTKADAKGVGLGLAVVYGIVKRHDGTIAVESAGGQGATFTIRMPRRPSAARLRETGPSRVIV